MFPTIASALAALFYCLSAFLIFKQLGTAQHHIFANRLADLDPDFTQQYLSTHRKSRHRRLSD